jgi:hypothetical protein
LFYIFESIRFPHVSSSPSSPKEHSSRPSSRPRTAPQIHAKEPTKIEFHSQSATVFQTNLAPIDENIETELLVTKTIVPQPTKIDYKRDIQILTLTDDDDEKNTQQITNVAKEQLPF